MTPCRHHCEYCALPFHKNEDGTYTVWETDEEWFCSEICADSYDEVPEASHED